MLQEQLAFQVDNTRHRDFPQRQEQFEHGMSEFWNTLTKSGFLSNPPIPRLENEAFIKYLLVKMKCENVMSGLG